MINLWNIAAIIYDKTILTTVNLVFHLVFYILHIFITMSVTLKMAELLILLMVKCMEKNFDTTRDPSTCTLFLSFHHIRGEVIEC